MTNLLVMQIRLPGINPKLYLAMLSGILALNQGCAVFNAAPGSVIEDDYYDIRHSAIY